MPTQAPPPHAVVTVLRQAQEGQLVEVAVAELVKAPVNSTSDRLVNMVLWAILGVFAIAIVWMALIAIRRSKSQSSDKE